MNNITKLGNLVHKFVAEFDVLRNERDNAVKKNGDIEIELKKAKVTINEFKNNGIEIQDTSENDLKIENKKREIINRIDNIIDSIDSMDLNNVTNV